MMVKPQSMRIVVPVKLGKLEGLGDLVALAAEPGAHVIRKVWSHWDCSGCEKRREILNRALQFRR